MDKARSWFNRACTLDPDIGDHWAAYYRFEAQHGGDENAAAVAERCKTSEPKHGELWQRVSKRVKNWHDDSVTLLKKWYVGHCQHTPHADAVTCMHRCITL